MPTSPVELPNLAFIQEVRTVLAHLYDHAYLQNHPLAWQLSAGRRQAAAPRAQQLRRTLLDCIERLRPQALQRGVTPAAEARAYAILAYRCVDGLSMAEIETKLALSRRQAYREYSKGVEAVASQLWDLLQRQSGPDETGEAVGLQQRLQLAQVEVARLGSEVHREALDLAAVLADVERLLAPRLQQTGRCLQVVLPDQTPAVLADRTLLRQALLNLLSHALDTLGTGDLYLHASLHADDLKFQIGNLAPSTGELRPASSAKREGVGLAVAKKLVEAQGGHWALTTEGPWRVTVSLPTANLATVLAVDDNEGLVALFQRYLAGHPVTVLGATTGASALRQAVERQPQAILLDLMMPQQDGWDLLQALQANPATRSIPVIICSVLNEVDLALALGASDYITKPVSQRALLTVLRHWLPALSPVG